MKRLTINDIAKRSGTSRSTVSRVLSDHPNVNCQTRARVQAIINDLNYIPNRLAQGLVNGKINVVGLIVGDIRNPYFSEITRAVEEVLNASGYLVVLCDSAYNPDKEVEFLNVSRELRFASIIMTSAMDNEGLITNLSKLSCPVVLLNRYLQGFRTDVVSFDNTYGAYLAAEHVIKLGHRKIRVLIGPAHSSSTIDREAGYRKAFSDHDLPCAKDPFVHGDLRFESGYQFGVDLIKEKNRPTAVLAGNDFMAMGIIKAYIDHGLKVPEDLSVTGFDDITIAGVSAVPLTTIRQPQVEMGRQAAQVALDRMQGSKGLPRRTGLDAELAGLPRRIIFDAELVVRRSTRSVLEHL